MGIRHYKVRLTTTGLVHIGNGNVLGKKDYFLHKGKIAVLDPAKFTSSLDADQVSAYCKFLETGSSDGLEDFLRKQGLQGIANGSIAYVLDTELDKANRGVWKRYSLAEFVKDAYGCPYVPGSSFKGVLRTALLAAIVAQDVRALRRTYPQGSNWRRSKKADVNLDKQAFWREHLNPDDPKESTDIMSFVSVSDSEPLSASDLVFAKKYDKFSRADRAEHKRRMGNQSTGDFREGNDLNIYRECLRPGTEIVFQLDIDERIDKYLPYPLDAEGVARAFADFDKRYEECFASHFDLGKVEGCGEEDEKSGGANAADGQCQYVIQAGPFAGRRCPNRAIDGTGYCNTHQDKASAAAETSNSVGGESVTCYLGGGVDFDSKTVLNFLFENGNERIDEISRILFVQFPTRIDERFGHGRHRALANEVREAGFEPRPMSVRYKRDGRVGKAKDDHRHWMDLELGVSPHTLKLGKVGDKLYLMGKCELSIEELPPRVASAKGVQQ